MRPELYRFIKKVYPELKAVFSDAGRRHLELRALDAFWASKPLPPMEKLAADVDAEWADDEDVYDEFLADCDGGIVLRTDFSNEEAWQDFCLKLKEAEQEMAADKQPAKDVDMDADKNEGEGDEDEDDEPGVLVKILDPVDKKAEFENISNIKALRLLNDVDIRPAPSPPVGTKRISPGHRLKDLQQWQEVYTGPTIWIYDAKSNTDRSVRLVSQQNNVYGTATGDSWRAQVSHIYELQFNMTYAGMQIDFGGMDRWDYAERKRNLDEANSN